MPLTYGGVSLEFPTGEAQAWVEANISLWDVVEFARLSWPGKNRVSWPWGGRADKDDWIRLGRLFWPVGASRFAHFHFLVDDATLTTLRGLVYGTKKAIAYNALPLVMDDGTTKITTSLYMLPPRPLSTGTATQEMWLLTLVDARYFWWETSTQINVTGGTTTWASLFTSIASALGITITTDTISADYLKPAADLTARYEFVPPLLDAVCYNIGHRLVRSLAGTVTTQQARTAAASQAKQFTLYPRMAGGKFRYTATDTANDLQALAPAAVAVMFPRTDSGVPNTSPYVATTTLTSLATPTVGQPAPLLSPEYTPKLPLQAITGHAGTKVFQSETVAAFTGGTTPTNSTELTTLAKRVSIDYYLWRLSKLDVVYAGIVPWTPEGMGDILWDYTAGRCATRILGRPYNDLAETLNHYGSKGVGPTIIDGAITYTSNVSFNGPATFNNVISYKPTYTTVTTNQNNVSVTTPILDYKPTSPVNVTGLVPTDPNTSQTVIITNRGTSNLTITHEDTNSTATNRFHGPGGSNVVLPPFTSAYVQYSPTDQRWIFIGSTATVWTTGVLPTGYEQNYGTSAALNTSPPGKLDLPTFTTSGAPTWTPAANTYPIAWNQASDTLYIWDGAAWKAISGAGGSGTPAWVKVTKTFTDFSFAGLSQNFNIYSLAAKGYIQAVVVKHSTSFTGGGIASYTVATQTGTGTLSAAFDVFQAPGNTVFHFEDNNSGRGPQNFGIATNVQATVTSTGANLSAATAGSVDIWLLVSTLP